MHFKIRNTILQIDLLLVFFILMGVVLDEAQQMFLLILSLCAHESAHFFCAHALHVAMASVRLTPFGGFAQIENPYNISPARLCAVALAGPLANLLLLIGAAAMCQWQILNPLSAYTLMQINLLLMLFNLMPALPLDGGRVLFAILSQKLPRQKALNIGLWIGRFLAFALIFLAIWGFFTYGQLNLSCFFSAAFLLASGWDERRALDDSRVRALFDSIRPLHQPTPASIVAIEANMPVQAILRSIHADQITLFAVYDSGKLCRIVDARSLIAPFSAFAQNSQDFSDKKS